MMEIRVQDCYGQELQLIMEKQFECVKIKDGLYLGNKTVAFDLEFLLINKFGYVVNCASEVPNLFEQHGIKYLKFKIKQEKKQNIFDQELKRLKKIKKIIAEAEDTGLCCLIHCNQSGNRSLVLLVAFLMDRFRWRLRKTLQFLQSKGVSIILTDSNIEELTNLEYIFSRQSKLSHLWIGPFVDEEEELLTKTFNNTAKQNTAKQGKPCSPIKKDVLMEDSEEVKAEKRVQWLDKLQKEEKKEKKRQLVQRMREEKMEKSKEKLDEEYPFKKDSKAHNMIMPKQKPDANKRSKKKLNEEFDTDIRRNMEEAQILKLLKKTGKLKKRLIQEQQKEQVKQRDSLSEEQITPKAEQKEDEKKVYKLTINNYINPNINIIKPPLDKKKKSKGAILKKEKDKFNRTYSEKEAFKKPAFFDKDISKGKETNTEKRNSGHTPLRSRKQRKSEKQKV